MCVYNKKCYTNYVKKVKNVECEEEVSHSGLRRNNEIINESEMSILLVVKLS